MRNKKWILCLCAVLLALLLPMGAAYANTPQSSENESGYSSVILDDADLLTDADEEAILAVMEEASVYGNMLFLSTNDNPYSSADTFTSKTYESLFGYAPGVAFTIDMDNRMLWICGFGEAQFSITDNYCDTITDNIYRYASDEEYFTCSVQAFTQIHAVLTGKDIPKPMKYICNFVVSAILAMILNYFLVMFVSRKKKTDIHTLQENMISHCNITNTNAVFTNETRVYNPPSSSGGSSGSGGGHSGGGGGHSGGGHSF